MFADYFQIFIKKRSFEWIIGMSGRYVWKIIAIQNAFIFSSVNPPDLGNFGAFKCIA